MKKRKYYIDGVKKLIKKIDNEDFLLFALFAIAPFLIICGIVLLLNLTSHKLIFDFILQLGFFIAAMNTRYIQVSDNFKQRVKNMRE